MTELEEEAKKIPHSPSLEIQSRTESENSTETLLSSHAPKVPAGARRFLPPIPLATNKLANFQFSDSSDDESEDLALPGI